MTSDTLLLINNEIISLFEQTKSIVIQIKDLNNVVIAFRGTSIEVPQVDNHKIILSSQAEGLEEYAVTKYHILFTKGTMVKTTNIKNNYIARIKTMNEI